jgi:hypothetical protein
MYNSIILQDFFLTKLWAYWCHCPAKHTPIALLCQYFFCPWSGWAFKGCLRAVRRRNACLFNDKMSGPPLLVSFVTPSYSQCGIIVGTPGRAEYCKKVRAFCVYISMSYALNLRINLVHINRPNSPHSQCGIIVGMPWRVISRNQYWSMRMTCSLG